MTTTVNAPCGRLEGVEEGGVVVFRGIPFAAPPAGELRFRAPERAVPWSGTREARRFGPSSVQSSGFPPWFQRWIGIGSGRIGEDCLGLNVWTPAADAARRPVMVWIHGGGFTQGTGSAFMYEGRRLAKRGDVVVVTVNYRLGVLGALDLGASEGAEDITANVGLLDQIASLEWVRDNIAAFGGDPEAVTLFGESAGAMSVAALLAAPRARGLFARAILQSGAAANVSAPGQSHPVAEDFVAAFRDVSPESAGMRLGEALRRAPLELLLRAQRTTSNRLKLPLGQLAWQPALDGEVLTRPPLEALRDGVAKDVSVLIGTNRDEWKLFTLGDRKRRSLDESTLRDYLERTLRTAVEGPEVDDETARCGAAEAFALYVRSSDGGAPRSPSDRWAAFQTDRVFRHPAIQLAEAQAAHGGSVHHYRFDWSPPLLGRFVGACHAMEIPFVFGSLASPRLRPLAIGGGAAALSGRMQRAWIAFAHSGDPGHEGLPEWRAYDGVERETMLLDRAPRSASDPEARERHFWSATHP